MSVWPKTSFTLIFALVWLFLITEVMFMYLISVFISDPRLIATVGPTLIFMFSMPRYLFFGLDPQDSSLSKLIVCGLSPTAFVLGTDLISQSEKAEKGINWGSFEERQVQHVARVALPARRRGRLLRARVVL